MSSSAALLVEVFLHEGRYHGEPEWPPSPARLFQALVAGVARGSALAIDDEDALRWFECLSPPVIGSPCALRGQAVKTWVPNNDLDAKGGDPAEVIHIRTGKGHHPRLFDPSVPFVYAWELDGSEDSRRQADRVVELASSLYQLGRGVDLGWARAARVSVAALDERLDRYAGHVHRPSVGAPTDTGTPLDCAVPGSLASLKVRHEATLSRFERVGSGAKMRVLFHQPPKALFRPVTYDSRPVTALFELRDGGGRFAARAQTSAVALVEAIRDAAALRLAAALPERRLDVERALVGRTPEGARRLDISARVRITPIPSIGHQHADRGIRRVMVAIPGTCPLAPRDVLWAVSGLELADRTVLTRTDDRAMLGHFGADKPARTFHTVTPAALPESASRRRIDPDRSLGDRKGGEERAGEEARALAAVRQALRHAGVRAALIDARVQREPFEVRGERAEQFAEGTRFPKERLWHVAVTFASPVLGPLVIGDGRFLGLGLMAAVLAEFPTAIGFRIEGGWSGSDPHHVARALRRAVMARFQAHIGPRARLPAYVSGHEKEGSPAKGHRHLYFVCDPDSQTLFVLPPHLRDRRAPLASERRILGTLDEALSDFTELRAGRAGVLILRRISTHGGFPVASTWASGTPYLVNRHRKGIGAAEAVERDVRAACEEAGLPVSRVDVANPRGIPGLGLRADVTLHFDHPVGGPILLGRDRFQGGGWFVPKERGSDGRLQSAASADHSPA